MKTHVKCLWAEDFVEFERVNYKQLHIEKQNIRDHDYSRTQ